MTLIPNPILLHAANERQHPPAFGAENVCTMQIEQEEVRQGPAPVWALLKVKGLLPLVIPADPTQAFNRVLIP